MNPVFIGVVIYLPEEVETARHEVAKIAGVEMNAGKPHITLYQALLEGVKLGQLVQCLEASKSLVDKPIVLKQIEWFRNKFLFWNLELTDKERSEWQRIQLTISQILQPHLSDIKNQPILNQGLDLSKNEQDEVGRIGYPYLTVPLHITIGHSIIPSFPGGHDYTFTTKAENIAVVVLDSQTGKILYKLL